ncbi:hypothetical protein [Rhizobium ruizarguesonis]|uniref:hypothetical protein n=1 Tax=Rhizobium ruizarguesonis TaxID=2081791 RepID=UPI0013EE72EC|nr:hypothetical protein [Rhizobium ruizarguesonis]
MTGNSKTPPAKKTIQDPPEYAASQASPSSSLDRMPPWSVPVADNVSLEDPAEIPENVAAPRQAAGRMGTGNIVGEAETPASDDPKDKKVGGRQQASGQSAEAPSSKDEERAHGEGARNPQTGE